MVLLWIVLKVNHYSIVTYIANIKVHYSILKESEITWYLDLHTYSKDFEAKIYNTPYLRGCAVGFCIQNRMTRFRVSVISFLSTFAYSTYLIIYYLNYKYIYIYLLL